MAAQNAAHRASDQVVAEIEKRIRTRELVEGQPLPPERDLMEEFGISRTVVREAVRILSSRGLVEARPRFRPVVRKPGYDGAVDVLSGIVPNLLTTKEGVKNLFDTRVLIEGALARQAAITSQKDDIADLKAALAANEAAMEDSEAFYATDKAFHNVLYKISGNPALLAVHRAYTTWLEPHWSQMPRLKERNARNYQAHKDIFDAILMRDPDAAEKALVEHLENAWTQVSSTFDSSKT